MTTVLQALNRGLLQAFEQDERVVLIGEDVLDPYGGAFKVTRGLSEAYPERVFSSPISEAGIIGLAGGMALRGLRPVVEIMFGDFLTLGADQIINHAVKFRRMYNDQVRVPLVVRTPMGGRRGYGATHSQTLEKHFLGVPGLTVLAANAIRDPGALLEETILKTQDPVLFIENKALYPQNLFDPQTETDWNAEDIGSCIYGLRLCGAPPAEITLATYGGMVETAREAVRLLAYEHEVFCEIVVFTQLTPFETSPLERWVRHSGALLTLEEGTYSLGWGAEILARCSDACGREMFAAGRVAALEMPIPSSGIMEKSVLPEADSVIRAAQQLMERKTRLP